MPSSRVTATNLYKHAHFHCDLYLHQSYHRGTSANTEASPTHVVNYCESPAAISEAAFTSGNGWESTVMKHLNQHGLLLNKSSPPLSGSEIASIIGLDDRAHFFVAGITFWPPSDRLAEEYAKHGVKAENVPRFGVAKPDLLEIWHKEDGEYVWRVIDVKASKNVQASHLVQTYFYYICLSLMLPRSFVPAVTVAIWLPSDVLSSVDSPVPFPSLETLHPTPIASLVAPLTDLIFIRLPAILSTAHSKVSWHFNPLCKSCPFSSTCRGRVEKEYGLGKAGEVTLSEANEIRGFMKLGSEVRTLLHLRQGAEIEDLVHDMDALSVEGVGENQGSELAQLRELIQDNHSMDYMETKWPASTKKVRRILALQHRSNPRASFQSNRREPMKLQSPVIEAALMNTPQFTGRQIYTLPSSEDIAIFISFIIDPSLPASGSTISKFCLTTRISPTFEVIARKYEYEPRHHIHGCIDDLIPFMSECIRNVLDLHAKVLRGHPNLPTKDHDDRLTRSRDIEDLPRTQFYVWSVQEKDALQKHLVNAALLFSNSQNPDDSEIAHGEDIRLCIGALCEGASLLATTFQPHVLEGALLGFLGKRGESKEKIKSIVDRFGIKLTGTETVEVMRQMILREIDRIGRHGEHRQPERRAVGLLPRVVVLKKELRRLMAIPVPGWWDVKEAGQILGLPSASRCPSEEELFRRYWKHEETNLVSGMEARNDTFQKLVSGIRRKMHQQERSKLLVNRATVMSVDWVDVCRTGVLRKLFYMQQFEVLLKLQELWDTRIEGCPDAPLLMYCSITDSATGGNQNNYGSTAQHHHFELLSGNLEVASESDRDRAFFDYILVEVDDEDNKSDEPKRASCHLPLEALFDDLCVSGLVFPLNHNTYSRWEDGQATEVKENGLWIANIRDVNIRNGRSQVVIQTWSGSGDKKLLPGRTYRLSPRLVDFNTTKMLSTLVELDLQTTSTTTATTTTTSSITHPPPFITLISGPKLIYGPRPAASSPIKVVLNIETSLHRLYTELHGLGNEDAGALVLKASQRRAIRRILSERLTVIWGPPGSGKSYTIALSLLRMVEVQSRTRALAPEHQQIIFVTAMTHAAIHACLSQLNKIIECYRCIPHLSLEWLDDIHIERVLVGSTHSKPKLYGVTKTHVDGSLKPQTWIYAGTVYQLYTFGKRLEREVDCVVIDEAGQLGLSAASLVLRALSYSTGIWGGKVVVAGDREQLAPIFSGKYPELGRGQPPLFGSVLDCLMGNEDWEEGLQSPGVMAPEDENAGTVVQLLENFRLNPDLGNFVQTIYERPFKPQKSQAKLLATQLKRLENEGSRDVMVEKCRNFFLSLSSVMLGQKQSLLHPPVKDTGKQNVKIQAHGDHGVYANPSIPRPISLAMVRLHVTGDPQGKMAYESHVHAEAKVAAVLVRLLEKACGEGDSIFVACPHKIQRAAVNLALSQWDTREGEQRVQGNDEDKQLQQIVEDGDGRKAHKTVAVTVDTIERLQGSEASFVICLFSYTHRGSLVTALPFLLARRRLNVAISRAKTLCIVISSEGVLRPGVSVSSDKESARGSAFLREFEDRAWNTAIEVKVEA